MKMNPAWIAARHCGRPSPDNEREESGTEEAQNDGGKHQEIHLEPSKQPLH